MKTKKAQFGLIGIAYLILILIILIMLVWFGVRISDGIVAIFEFLKEWWWAIALGLSAIIWNKQLTAIVNFILNKIGIKIK